MNTKAKHQLMKYEDVIPNHTFAFTFAPEDRHQYWETEDRYNKFRIGMQTFLLHNLGTTSVKYRIELSPTGRLHLHGYITIKDKMEFFLYTIRKLDNVGTVSYKPLLDEETWEAYCTKQGIETDYHYVPIVTKPLLKSPRKNRTKFKDHPIGMDHESDQIPLGSVKNSKTFLDDL